MTHLRIFPDSCTMSYMNTKKMLTAAQAAKILNLTAHEVRYLCRHGRIDGAVQRSEWFWEIPAKSLRNVHYGKPGPKPGNRKNSEKNGELSGEVPV